MRETHDIAEHVKAGLELSPEQEKRLKHLDTKNEIIYGILDMMLEPVYLKMRELGYSHEDLIR
ncbi:hypothetical protein HYY71_03675 [Candidatus Woesearchaeota archaeon]|nr:hypothetical protein [Candidatus Woesearchaeota archaeon]